MYLNQLIKKKNPIITTCNRLDLETLEVRPAMPKTLPGHWTTRACK